MRVILATAGEYLFVTVSKEMLSQTRRQEEIPL